MELKSSAPSPSSLSTNKSYTRLHIRRRIANFREQVEKENHRLKSGDEREKLKRSVGGWALTPNQLQYLSNSVYEYNASAGSILETLVMQKFWTWLSSFIPMRIAPCTITAIGFFINLITCSIMIWYSPDAKNEVPQWPLLLCALGVWLYQIADALDGKQCYKVQNSQLEEFYDHGCDSVSTILLMYSSAISIQAGHCPPLFLMVVFTSLFAFYTTHWLSYITNQMVFGRIDVTEAQCTMILIHLISALFGQSIWSYKLLIFGYNVPLRILLSLITLSSLLSSILKNASIILFKFKTPLERAGISIPRREQTNVFKPIVPALFLTFLIVYCYDGYYKVNSTIFILAFGLNFAKLTMKLVIAHCTNHQIELMDLTLVAPILLALNELVVSSFSDPIVSHDKALLGAFIWDTIELIRYFTFISWDIVVALDLEIFSIKYPPGHPKSRLQTGGYYINGLNDKEIISKKQPKQNIKHIN